MMRAYFIAGLVSLSCAACGSNALGQQPLWFTPHSPQSNTATSSTDASRWQESAEETNPFWSQAIASPHPLAAEKFSAQEFFKSKSSASTATSTTLTQRFGDLLSKPGMRLAIAMGNEQASVVTAGGGELSSPSTSTAVPWATVREREGFSFAEYDANAAQSRTHDARQGRGAQVSALSPLVTTQQSEAPRTTHHLSDPSQESREPLPAYPSVPTQLVSSARQHSAMEDDLSLILPIPANKLAFQAPPPPPGFEPAETPPKRLGERPLGGPAPVARSMGPERVARLQAPDSAQSAIVSQAGEKRDSTLSNSEAPVVSRITDQTDEDKHKAANNSSSGSPKPSPADETSLLNTESMIGPLKGADLLFGRLELDTDFRGVAAPAQTGPRNDSYHYSWMPTPYTWISPAFYHYPLYFEQPNLERYGIGRARAVQPLLSSIHFFGSIPLVPYKTLTHHPRERVYTLGQGRPGNCVPIQRGVVLGQSTVGEVSMFWEECSGYR